MTSLSRDAFLRMILPAGLVLFVYFVAPLYLSLAENLNPQAVVSRLEKRVAEGRQRVPPPALLMAEIEAIRKLNEQRDQLKGRKNQLDQDWQALTTGVHGGNSSAQVLANVEALLARHGLQPLDQGPPPQDEGHGQLPLSLQNLLLNLSENKTIPSGQLVRLRFVGRYREVLRAVTELSQKDWHLYPVSLTMEEADWSTQDRTWSLVLWL